MIDFVEWFAMLISHWFGHPIFDAAALGLVFGMGTIEFVARMLPARTLPSIATRISWAIACVASFGVALLLNPTSLGLAVALTVSVSAPSLQLVIMREVLRRCPHLGPESMRENPILKLPSEVNWP